jgi:hypothetical protein
MKTKTPNYDKVTFETFREIGSYEINNFKSNNPSSLNGWVRIRKFKVTIEPIIEPIEVLSERLQKLWDECDNHHHWQPLRAAAKQIGYELQGKPGSANKR